MFENIRLSFQGIWSHKLRSFLTMLGIIIGIAAIIAIVSTIEGTNELIKQNMMGNNRHTVKVQLSQDDYTYEISTWNPSPEGVPLFDEDTRQEILQIPNVLRAAFYQVRSEYNSVVFYNNQSSVTRHKYFASPHKPCIKPPHPGTMLQSTNFAILQLSASKRFAKLYRTILFPNTRAYKANRQKKETVYSK